MNEWYFTKNYEKYSNKDCWNFRYLSKYSNFMATSIYSWQCYPVVVFKFDYTIPYVRFYGTTRMVLREVMVYWLLCIYIVSYNDNLKLLTSSKCIWSFICIQWLWRNAIDPIGYKISLNLQSKHVRKKKIPVKTFKKKLRW